MPLFVTMMFSSVQLVNVVVINKGFFIVGIMALTDIKGLSKARYFKSDKYVYSFSNQPVFTKLDNDSFDDVCSRMKYITKLDQKSDEIPFTKTFGTSQIKPLPITGDDSLQQVA